MPVNLQQPYFR